MTEKLPDDLLREGIMQIGMDHVARNHPTLYAEIVAQARAAKGEQATKEREEIRRHIMNAIDDAIGDFVYYDRKESQHLPPGLISQAIRAGDITAGEIVARFNKNLNDIDWTTL